MRQLALDAHPQVINNLFKIYFQLNNLRLCQNLIRAVEGPGFPKALDGEVATHKPLYFSRSPLG